MTIIIAIVLTAVTTGCVGFVVGVFFTLMAK